MPKEYIEGWAALSELMDEGASWSGHERNCCYLNLRDGTFVDISAVSGLDFLDDGRAMATVDWDHDGDLDVWLKNRTSPALRFMENLGSNVGAPSNSYLALKLIGTTSNRDAIGTKVTVSYDGKKQTRCVTAGSGYLSQSSRWLHFGLGQAKHVDHVLVRWPNGNEQIVSVTQVNKRFVITQGDSKVVEQERQPIKLAPPQSTNEQSITTSRMVLKVPLPLPPSLVFEAFSSTDQKKPLLINLWAQWCAGCVGELSEFAGQIERIHKVGLDVLALNIDTPDDRAKAVALFGRKIRPLMKGGTFAEKAIDADLLETIDALIDHVRGRLDDWPMPLSFLVDGDGSIQIVYLGPVSVDQLLIDYNDYVATPRKANQRFSFPGRWYFRNKRNLEALAQDLKARGRREDSIFYMKRHLGKSRGAPTRK